MSKRFPVVTVDGPAASGKSSVSRELARVWGWNWVSTGAFYRGLAYVAHEMKIPFHDEDALVQLIESDVWAIEMDDDQTHVFFNDDDVTDEVGREETGNYASQVSQLPRVRKALLEPQRSCAFFGPGLVAEGRDCGTVVFPDAVCKVYLTASSRDRAARRALEKGQDINQTYEQQKERDSRDLTRPTAPLQVPPEAIVIDTSELNLEDVVRLVREQVEPKIEPFLST